MRALDEWAREPHPRMPRHAATDQDAAAPRTATTMTPPTPADNAPLEAEVSGRRKSAGLWHRRPAHDLELADRTDPLGEVRAQTRQLQYFANSGSSLLASEGRWSRPERLSQCPSRNTSGAAQ